VSLILRRIRVFSPDGRQPVNFLKTGSNDSTAERSFVADIFQGNEEFPSTVPDPYRNPAIILAGMDEASILSRRY